jgi:hypothetical protein
MREHLIKTSWSSIYSLNIGKKQKLRKSAGNRYKLSSSSETAREKLKINEKFKWWFFGFSKRARTFKINRDSYLEFIITQSSKYAQILFYIKKQLGFRSVCLLE